MLTVGHSSHSQPDFLELLRASGIECLVDIRSHPGSRRHPWFNQESLARTLTEAGIEYRWEGRAFGGKRGHRPGDADRHPALTGAGLQAFARYMEEDRFREAIDRALTLSPEATALMCAEADPGRCHRSLVADYLEAVRDCPVFHIMGSGGRRRHTLHPGAHPVDGRLRYDRHCVQPLPGLE